MRLIHGDCVKVLNASIDSNSIDALLTDPPAGIAFMGKDWDKDMGGRDQWIEWMTSVMLETYRVLKPGAHGLVWALPRTSHWTATALENAGFEIRDVVTHLFGSGFPKSQNISKAIDKAAGAEREVIGRRPNAHSKGKHKCAEGWKRPWMDRGEENYLMETAPATEDAKTWDGWGTALKPSHEDWILIRKPISEKTIAKNVQKWGTGGINIDGCRIEAVNNDPNNRGDRGLGRSSGGFNDSEIYGTSKLQKEIHQTQGRFPANTVLSGDAHDMLDEQTKDTRAGKPTGGGKAPKNSKANSVFGNKSINTVQHNEKHVTGASRFFYCAKPSKKERGNDNNHPTVKSIKLMGYFAKLITPPAGTVLDPFMGSGSTALAAKEQGFDFIGIEKEQEYFEIAKNRIKNSTAHK